MGHRKFMKKFFPKMVSIGLVAVLAVGMTGVATVQADTDDASDDEETYDSTYDAEEYTSERLSTNYTKVSAAYTAPVYTGSDVVYCAADCVTDIGSASVTTDTYDYDGSSSVIDLAYGSEFTIEIDVPQDGQYWVLFDYLSYDDSILPIEMAMQVDGEYPFYECRSLNFETYWEQDEEPSYDRYGNEMVTIPNKKIEWEQKYLMDSSYRHSTPLLLELTAGTHEVSFEVKEGTFLLGDITLTAPTEIAEYTGSEVAEGDAFYEIEGEGYAYTNDSSIHAVVEYDTSLTPYSVSDTVLNTIDSDSFNTAGQSITYSVDIEDAGYYYIGMNYRQSDKSDFPVFVDVYVDGVIPNTEFQAYSMAYTTKYKTTTLADEDGNYLSVYLEPGTHEITFTISLDPICYIMEALDEIMSEINDLSLEITKVAGTNADKYRDLKITRYIPGIEDELYGYSEELTELEESALKWSSSTKNVAVMSSMIVAAKRLAALADEPDEIPYRIDELSTSSSSANQYLANTIDDLIENGLAIDRVYIYQEGATLPKKPNIFKSAYMNVSRFVASFTEQNYSTSNTNKEHLQVWVNRASQYVQIMQKLIDEEFTPETGIEVDISIMPDQYKLVLANSTGNAPDVATGINYTIPYELAVRGALVDMTQFDDFQEVASPYEPGFFMTGTIGDSVYSMPETMNWWVLFYRTDVMEKLGLDIPQTMDDVIDMLPELQMRGLNFYYPVSGMITMRNFHGTTPLIVQHGGSLYYDTADLGTAFGSEASVEGFTYMTDLFTVYDMPINIDNFYQHFRNGDLPIGIADYATYNLVKNAAPELSSSWEIAVAPGTLQEDGTIDRSTCGCAESTVIFKNDKNPEREEMAWEFVRWWSSTATQAEFGQTIQITYGDEYIWPTANLEAFDLLPIDTDDKKVIEEFAKNVVDVPRVPGTYLLEREISNAFNDIVVNGANEQTRIDKAVKTINREFDRKLMEFGYNDSDGNVIEYYEIPTIDRLKVILGREDED